MKRFWYFLRRKGNWVVVTTIFLWYICLWIVNVCRFTSKVIRVFDADPRVWKTFAQIMEEAPAPDLGVRMVLKVLKETDRLRWRVTHPLPCDLEEALRVFESLSLDSRVEPDFATYEYFEFRLKYHGKRKGIYELQGARYDEQIQA